MSCCSLGTFPGRQSVWEKKKKKNSGHILLTHLEPRRCHAIMVVYKMFPHFILCSVCFLTWRQTLLTWDFCPGASVFRMLRIL